MRLPALGSPERKTVVVLGAGASRGSSQVGDALLKPPVDRDFFRILQMSETGRSDDGRQLLNHVRTAYGPALSVGMETVFTNLEAARTFHQELRVGPGRIPQWPDRLIDAFRSVLPSLLEETLPGGCTYHERLASQLRVIDTVVSLNYDCLIDDALCSSAGSRFAAGRGGYGVEISRGAAMWRGHAPGPVPDGSIKLLKLHGSLNWDRAEVPLPLRLDLYDPVAAGVIQPPLTNKPITDEPFNSIWKQARIATQTARRLIVIGYSMPVADGLVRSLFVTDLEPVLEEVVIVEPDPGTRDRHVDFFTRLADAPRVFALDTLADFARMIG